MFCQREEDCSIQREEEYSTIGRSHIQREGGAMLNDSVEPCSTIGRRNNLHRSRRLIYLLGGGGMFTHIVWRHVQLMCRGMFNNREAG